MRRERTNVWRGATFSWDGLTTPRASRLTDSLYYPLTASHLKHLQSGWKIVCLLGGRHCFRGKEISFGGPVAWWLLAVEIDQLAYHQVGAWRILAILGSPSPPLKTARIHQPNVFPPSRHLGQAAKASVTVVQHVRPGGRRKEKERVGSMRC